MSYGSNTYTYNADWIRTSKTVNGVEHIYHLSGTRILDEEWVSGSTRNLLIYIYDASGQPIGINYLKCVGNTVTKEAYLLGTNIQGDITCIYDTAGNRVVTYTYDAWGKILSVTGTAANTIGRYNPFRYRGYYYDNETGFYYLNSRYYDPNVGRFLNADGYINANGDLIGFNMFAYCGNNPVNASDPLGRWYIKDGIKWLTKNVMKPVTDSVQKAMGKLGNATHSAGVAVSAAFGGGISGTIGLATDNQGNVGFVASWSILAASPNASVSVYRSFTNAPSIKNLEGISVVAGGSVDVYGVSIGGEFTSFADTDTNDIYVGGAVSAGVGAPIPIEVHGGVNNARVGGMFNVFDVLNKLYNRISAW